MLINKETPMSIQSIIKKINSLSTELYGKGIIKDFLYATNSNEASIEKNKKEILKIVEDMKKRLNILEASLKLSSNV